MQKISIRNAKYAKIGLQTLINYIGDCSNMIMAEIGSYVGDSSEIFAQNFKIIYCIDPWINGYDDKDKASFMCDMKVVENQFDDLCLKYKNINKIKETSEQGSLHFQDKSFDFVYIDGLHNYEGVKNDIKIWLPKIKKNCWIGGHDYISKHFPGVKKAVDEFFTPDMTFRDSSWIKRL